MIVLKVLKIIGSIILIIGAILYYIYFIDKKRKEYNDGFEGLWDKTNDLGICFMLLGIAAILLATL